MAFAGRFYPRRWLLLADVGWLLAMVAANLYGVAEGLSVVWLVFDLFLVSLMVRQLRTFRLLRRSERPMHLRWL